MSRKSTDKDAEKYWSSQHVRYPRFLFSLRVLELLQTLIVAGLLSSALGSVFNLSVALVAGAGVGIGSLGLFPLIMTIALCSKADPRTLYKSALVFAFDLAIGVAWGMLLIASSILATYSREATFDNRTTARNSLYVSGLLSGLLFLSYLLCCIPVVI